MPAVPLNEGGEIGQTHRPLPARGKGLQTQTHTSGFESWPSYRRKIDWEFFSTIISQWLVAWTPAGHNLLGHRLMAGHKFLVLVIEVRVLVPQPPPFT